MENSLEKSVRRLPARPRGREERVRGALVARGLFAGVERMRPARAARRVVDSGAAVSGVVAGAVAGADTAADFAAAEKAFSRRRSSRRDSGRSDADAGPSARGDGTEGATRAGSSGAGVTDSGWACCDSDNSMSSPPRFQLKFSTAQRTPRMGLLSASTAAWSTASDITVISSNRCVYSAMAAPRNQRSGVPSRNTYVTNS